MDFDYFYNREAERFNFLKVPEILVDGEEFKGLSAEAIILYSMLLKRTGMSFKNNWVDKEGRRWEVSYGVCTYPKRLKEGKNKGCIQPYQKTAHRFYDCRTYWNTNLSIYAKGCSKRYSSHFPHCVHSPNIFYHSF